MSSPFALSMWTRDGAAGAALGAPRSAHPRWSPLVPQVSQVSRQSGQQRSRQVPSRVVRPYSPAVYSEGAMPS